MTTNATRKIEVGENVASTIKVGAICFCISSAIKTVIGFCDRSDNRDAEMEKIKSGFSKEMELLKNEQELKLKEADERIVKIQEDSKKEIEKIKFEANIEIQKIKASGAQQQTP